MTRGRVVEIDSEHLVLSRNSRSSDIFLVLSGYVLLQSSSPQGRQFVIDVVKPGQLFGFAGLLGLPSERLDAIALTAGKLAALDPAVFEKALRETPEFAIKVVHYLMRRLQRRTQQVEDLVMLSFGSRLAKWLLNLDRKSTRLNSSHRT